MPSSFVPTDPRTGALKYSRKLAKRAAGSAVELLESRVLLSSSWFVSGSAGSDSNPGTLAAPFKTIQHAASLAQAGDTVCIRAGVYHETVTPAHTGTASAPITFKPYNNDSVTIDGADAISGWVRNSGSVYSAPQSWDLGDGGNQVFIDGQMLTEARWPNTSLDPMRPTWAVMGSATANIAPSGLSTATINDSALTQPAGYWVGATIHMSPGQGWVWQTGAVTASSPGSVTIRYQQLTKYETPAAGNHFYLSGKFQALDTAGEWYRDPTSGKLYVWTPSGDSPASHVLEAKSRQFGFDFSNRAYINVQGVKLFSCAINTNSASNHITLAGLSAAFVSQRMDNAYPWGVKYSPHTTGIQLNGSYNSIVSSVITYSSGDGVFLGGSNNTVQGCIIRETNYAGGDEAGVGILGSYDTVTRSNIYDTGRSGITHYFSPRAQITNNIIHDIGLLTSDAGATYSWQTDGQGTLIADNMIYNARGAGYGNTGIFLDNNCSNFILHHNVVWNSDSALKMNMVSGGNHVYNNTLVGANALNTNYGATLAGSQFYNNIFAGPVAGALYASGVSQADNLFSASAAKFVDPAHANYQLQTGSAAIDKGMVVAPYTNGYVGSAPDIGAYEFNGAPFQAGVPMPPRDARTLIRADSFDADKGIGLQPPGIGSLDNTDWVRYSSMQFGTGVSRFTATLAVPATFAGQKIEVHLDSPGGVLVGTLTTTSTGAWNNFVSETTSVVGPTGLHDLFLVFRGAYGVCNLASFQFS